MNTALVSVIIPVFNAEEFLERCIASVIQQSYKNLEIILVDDGSTDSSTAICCEWEKKDERIVYIRQENMGLGVARNTGIKATKAEYIAFLDADDWFELSFVEKIIVAMLENKSDVGQCDIYYVNSKTMLRDAMKLRFDCPIVSCSKDKSVMNKSRLFGWGKIFKKELLDRLNFNFPAITYEDTCVPVIIASANQISYIPEPLINYLRNRSGSLSNDFRNIGDIGKGLKQLFDKLHELGKYEDYSLEYKKIALGQLRFACRKWGALNDEGVAKALQELEGLIAGLIPELKGISQKKYLAFDSPILASALDKALPYAEQATTDISSVSGVVTFATSLYPPQGYRLITIPEDMKSLGDNEINQFNIAELIMEKL